MMTPREEMREAIHLLETLVGAAHGTSWSVAYETTPEDKIPIGVEADDGTLVMGDSITRDGVAEADAKFIAMMDPVMGERMLDFLNVAYLNTYAYGKFDARTQDLQELALRVARHIKRKRWEGLA